MSEAELYVTSHSRLAYDKLNRSERYKYVRIINFYKRTFNLILGSEYYIFFSFTFPTR